MAGWDSGNGTALCGYDPHGGLGRWRADVEPTGIGPMGHVGASSAPGPGPLAPDRSTIHWMIESTAEMGCFVGGWRAGSPHLASLLITARGASADRKKTAG